MYILTYITMRRLWIRVGIKAFIDREGMLQYWRERKKNKHHDIAELRCDISNLAKGSVITITWAYNMSRAGRVN